jgi:hypothetical protein
VIHRRSFIAGIGALLAAPAVVRAAAIMPTTSEVMAVVGIDWSRSEDFGCIATIRMIPEGDVIVEALERLASVELPTSSNRFRARVEFPREMIRGQREFTIISPAADMLPVRLGDRVRVERRE